jgi:hypothetical protein
MLASGLRTPSWCGFGLVSPLISVALQWLRKSTAFQALWSSRMQLALFIGATETSCTTLLNALTAIICMLHFDQNSHNTNGRGVSNRHNHNANGPWGMTDVQQSGSKALAACGTLRCVRSGTLTIVHTTCYPTTRASFTMYRTRTQLMINHSHNGSSTNIGAHAQFRIKPPHEGADNITLLTNTHNLQHQMSSVRSYSCSSMHSRC